MGPTQQAAVNSTKQIDEGRSFFGNAVGRSYAGSVLRQPYDDNNLKPANPFSTSRVFYLHASVLATWSTSQLTENKHSVPRHASLAVAG